MNRLWAPRHRFPQPIDMAFLFGCLLLANLLAACGAGAAIPPTAPPGATTTTVRDVATPTRVAPTPDVPLPPPTALAATPTAVDSAPSPTRSAATVRSVATVTASPPIGATPDRPVPTPKRPSASTPAAGTATRSGGLAFVRAGDLWQAESPTGSPQIRQLTRRGDVQSVAASPDGRQLAYAAGSRNATELYLWDRPAGAERRLTNNRLYDGQPAWSPDGKLLIFTRGDAEVNDGGLEVMKGEIWRMDADGRNQRRLAVGKFPAWAPDGRRIAFLTNGVPLGPTEPFGLNEVHLMNWEGQNEWSVLKISDLPKQVDLGGVVFGLGARGFSDLTWTRRGRALAVSLWGGIGAVATISDTAQDLTIVAGAHEGGIGRVRGQPNGDLIAYEVLGASGVANLEIAPANLPAAKREGRVTIGGPRAGLEALRPAWAPDGQSLALTTAKADAPAERQLRVYTSRGTATGAAWGEGQIEDVAWD